MKTSQPASAICPTKSRTKSSAGAVLVTNNVREFERVEGLRVVNWVERDN